MFLYYILPKTQNNVFLRRILCCEHEEILSPESRVERSELECGFPERNLKV